MTDQPHKLLLVSTGNIHDRDLLRLFRERVHRLAELFHEVSYVEMTRNHLIVHNPDNVS